MQPHGRVDEPAVDCPRRTARRVAR